MPENSTSLGSPVLLVHLGKLFVPHIFCFSRAPPYEGIGRGLRRPVVPATSVAAVRLAAAHVNNLGGVAAEEINDNGDHDGANAATCNHASAR